MKHWTLPRFWQCYHQLPPAIRQLADKNYALLKVNPHHPSLQLKRIGGQRQLWSVRVGGHHRALGLDKPEGVVWFWIGTHSQYNHLVSQR